MRAGALARVDEMLRFSLGFENRGEFTDLAGRIPVAA
jgi:hypothetical protein